MKNGRYLTIDNCYYTDNGKTGINYGKDKNLSNDRYWTIRTMGGFPIKSIPYIEGVKRGFKI
jgi:hypothetical protein